MRIIEKVVPIIYFEFSQYSVKYSWCLKTFSASTQPCLYRGKFANITFFFFSCLIFSDSCHIMYKSTLNKQGKDRHSEH